MLHVGDIKKLSGYELPPVDVVTGGSPCQDLSIAGVRKGLDGERSGLFLEQIRIVKELREADKQRGRTNQLVRPRFMVWENVPGAFSSNGGRDFQRVLTECVRIAEPDAPDVPPPDKGRWTKAGILVGDGWSVAWRVLDAQYWGVPQRRRRIALVCDFGGQSAGEILFNAQGVSGHFTESGTPGKETAPGTGDCAYPTVARSLTTRMDGSPCIDRGPEIIVQNGVKCLNPWDSQSGRVYDAGGVFHSLVSCENAGMQRDAVLTDCVIPIHDKATRYQGGGDTRNNDGAGNGMGVGKNDDPCPTLSTVDRHAVFVAGFSYGQGAKARSIGYQEELSPTLRGGEGSDQRPCVYDARRNGDENCLTPWDVQSKRIFTPESVCGTLNAGTTEGVNIVPCVYDARGNGDGITVNTLTGDHESRVTDYTALAVHQNQSGEVRVGSVANTLSTNGNASGRNAPLVAVNCRDGTESEINGTLQAKETGYSLNTNITVRQNGVVRRLTPLECERLQGYPSGYTDIGDWTDSNGKTHKPSDSARYRALGNSIALPPWKWVLKRIAAQYERDATLGSLFDGIGGFPLIWEQINGKGSAVWASEIEPFCIAVTKRRLG